MKFARKWRLVLFFISVLALAPAAFAGPATFTNVNYPGATGGTIALGINPAGDIVGAYADNSGEHGFLLHAGAYTSFDFPGALWTDAYAITPQGDIVGQYGNDPYTTHGFLLRNGNFYPIDISGPTNAGTANTMPFGMNPNGTIAGCYHQGAPNGSVIGTTMHGFVLNANGASFDPVAGTMHTGINPEGDLTGYSTNGQSYVISASDGATEWFTVPGAAATRALGISATGDVVGWYKDSLGKFHGFLRHQGVAVPIDVDFSGVTQTRASGINPAGDIVGYYSDATGLHGFLLSKRSGD